MKIKTITTVGLISALYVAITIILAPISFGIFQFRVSELLKPIALKGKRYVIALTIGLFLANLFSPSVGLMELIFMPIVCAGGGILSYLIRKRPIISTTLYALIISLGVAVTLLVNFNAPFFLTFCSIFISEFVLMHIGGILVDYIFGYTTIEK